mmetsp:Transcript_45064/g.139043  ORF Transcript_45064/g.139043 Transcript_45064/m.139043 type:complete len:349 (+) Transcript_45064:1608-2654(+)
MPPTLPASHSQWFRSPLFQARTRPTAPTAPPALDERCRVMRVASWKPVWTRRSVTRTRCSGRRNRPRGRRPRRNRARGPAALPLPTRRTQRLAVMRHGRERRGHPLGARPSCVSRSSLLWAATARRSRRSSRSPIATLGSTISTSATPTVPASRARPHRAKAACTCASPTPTVTTTTASAWKPLSRATPTRRASPLCGMTQRRIRLPPRGLLTSAGSFRCACRFKHRRCGWPGATAPAQWPLSASLRPSPAASRRKPRKRSRYRRCVLKSTVLARAAAACQTHRKFASRSRCSTSRRRRQWTRPAPRRPRRQPEPFRPPPDRPRAPCTPRARPPWRRRLRARWSWTSS